MKPNLEEIGTVKKEHTMGKDTEQRRLFWACVLPQNQAGLLEGSPATHLWCKNPRVLGQPFQLPFWLGRPQLLREYRETQGPEATRISEDTVARRPGRRLLPPLRGGLKSLSK